jgi:hypothetical protein
MTTLHAAGAATTLVVNADDLGYTQSIDAGILHAHRDGVVTATSLLVTFPELPRTLARLREYPGLDLGLHLNLTWGASLTAAPSLTRDGQFLGSPKALLQHYLGGRLRDADLRGEIRAQMARFADCCRQRWHVDTHQHVLLLPPVARTVAELAAQFGFRWIRYPLETGRGLGLRRLLLNAAGRAWPFRGLLPTHRCLGVLTSGKLDPATLARLLSGLPPGIHELVCHPGYAPAADAAPDGLATRRSAELEALCDPALRALLSRRGITLAGWRNLQESRG